MADLFAICTAPARPAGLADVQARAEVLAPSHAGRTHFLRRLAAADPESLSDTEMLELTIAFADPAADSCAAAVALMARFGSMGAAIAAAADDIRQVAGMSAAAVSALKLLYAASLRVGIARITDAPVLSSWSRLTDYVQARLSHESIERARVLFLDNRNRLIADEETSRGTINHTPVYPREIIKRALEVGAAGMVLLHNHPSGDPSPSREDIALTSDIKKAAEALGMSLHDHLVVGRNSVFSFHQSGLL